MLKEIHQLAGSHIGSDNRYVKLGFLINEEINESKIVEYAYQKSKFDKSNFRLILFPSYACNLRCRYCFVRDLVNNSSQVIPSEIITYFEEVGNLIRNSNSARTSVTIMGGEPLLFANEILTFINKLGKMKNIYVRIVTNGTILDKKNILEIAKSPVNLSFQVSFDGPPEYHNHIKGGNNAFNSSISFINYLTSTSFNGYISIRINISQGNKSLIKETLNSLKSKLSDLEKISFYPAMIRDAAGTPTNLKSDYCIPEEDAYLYFSEFYSTCISLGLKYSIHLSPLLRNCVYLNENSFVVAS